MNAQRSPWRIVSVFTLHGYEPFFSFRVSNMISTCLARIDEIFQKESDPFTTNEGMLEVINTIRFRHFDKAVEVCQLFRF